MSILVKGMGMPKTCVQCCMRRYDQEKIWNDNGIERIGTWTCIHTGEVIWNTQRGENCPLVPLPEKHGRLIDADALTKLLNEEEHKAEDEEFYLGVAWFRTFKRLTELAPTIVPAEGGGGG